MVSFRILNIQGNNYLLMSEKNLVLNLIIIFYGMTPEINDLIFINENLLDRKSEKFCQPYSFTLSDENDYNNNGEFLFLKHNDNNFVFKRIYG